MNQSANPSESLAQYWEEKAAWFRKNGPSLKSPALQEAFQRNAQACDEQAKKIRAALTQSK
jgi:hypothetical protein